MGKIFLSSTVVFSQGWIKSMITSVLPGFLALNTKTFLPGTPTIPADALPGCSNESTRLRYSVSNWFHHSKPVEPALDFSSMVKFPPAMTLTASSQGALSQTLPAEVEARANKIAATAARNMLAILFILSTDTCTQTLYLYLLNATILWPG